jgi:CHASE2 domain-containing sensor protein
MVYIVYIACRILLIQGGWIPLIPTGIALLITTGGSFAIFKLLLSQQQLKYNN